MLSELLSGDSPETFHHCIWLEMRGFPLGQPKDSSGQCSRATGGWQCSSACFAQHFVVPAARLMGKGCSLPHQHQEKKISAGNADGDMLAGRSHERRCRTGRTPESILEHQG